MRVFSYAVVEREERAVAKRLLAALAIGGLLGTLLVQWVREADPGSLGMVAFFAAAFVVIPGLAATALSWPRLAPDIGAILGAGAALAPLLVSFLWWAKDPHLAWDLSVEGHIVWGVTLVLVAAIPGAAGGATACVVVGSLQSHLQPGRS